MKYIVITLYKGIGTVLGISGVGSRDSTTPHPLFSTAEYAELAEFFNNLLVDSWFLIAFRKAMGERREATGDSPKQNSPFVFCLSTLQRES